MIRGLLAYVAANLPPPRIIFDRAGKSEYLSRWYLVGRPTMPDGSHPFTEDGSPKEGILDPDRLFAVFLHKFHRGDDDAELHNHPWKWAVSLVLSGGYREERRRGAPERGGAVSIRTVFPWTVNLIHHDTFHRVDLLEKDAWSLFLAGPREKGWGFWNRSTGRYMPWRDFITWRRDPTAFLQAQARLGEPTSQEGRWWARVVEAERQRRLLDEAPRRPRTRPTPTNTFYADSASFVDRAARFIAGEIEDREHCVGDEPLVEVEAFEERTCFDDDDCRICDGYRRRAEQGDPEAHRAVTL